MSVLSRTNLVGDGIGVGSELYRHLHPQMCTKSARTMTLVLLSLVPYCYSILLVNIFFTLPQGFFSCGSVCPSLYYVGFNNDVLNLIVYRFVWHLNAGCVLLIGYFDAHTPVTSGAGTGRNQSAHDDVFFQAT